MAKLGSLMKVLVGDAVMTDAKEAQKTIERWFDEGIERSSGWYKRKMQWLIVPTAVVVVVILNVDSFKIADALRRDSSLRAAVVAAAEKAIAEKAPGEAEAQDKPSKSAVPAGNIKEVGAMPTETPDSPMTRIASQVNALSDLDLPIGWKGWRKGNESFWHAVGQAVERSFLGWLVTALAASLGAPFWFDLLNKLVNLRIAGKPPAPAKEQPEQA